MDDLPDYPDHARRLREFAFRDDLTPEMRKRADSAIEALIVLGAITPQEWEVLEERARTDWTAFAERYSGDPEHVRVREVIRKAYRLWSADRLDVSRGIGCVLDRIGTFLGQVRSMVVSFLRNRGPSPPGSGPTGSSGRGEARSPSLPAWYIYTGNQISELPLGRFDQVLPAGGIPSEMDGYIRQQEPSGRMGASGRDFGVGGGGAEKISKC